MATKEKEDVRSTIVLESLVKVLDSLESKSDKNAMSATTETESSIVSKSDVVIEEYCEKGILLEEILIKDSASSKLETKLEDLSLSDSCIKDTCQAFHYTQIISKTIFDEIKTMSKQEDLTETNCDKLLHSFQSFFRKEITWQRKNNVIMPEDQYDVEVWKLFVALNDLLSNKTISKSSTKEDNRQLLKHTCEDLCQLKKGHIDGNSIINSCDISLNGKKSQCNELRLRCFSMLFLIMKGIVKEKDCGSMVNCKSGKWNCLMNILYKRPWLDACGIQSIAFALDAEIIINKIVSQHSSDTEKIPNKFIGLKCMNVIKLLYESSKMSNFTTFFCANSEDIKRAKDPATVRIVENEQNAVSANASNLEKSLCLHSTTDKSQSPITCNIEKYDFKNEENISNQNKPHDIPNQLAKHGPDLSKKEQNVTLNEEKVHDFHSARTFYFKSPKSQGRKFLKKNYRILHENSPSFKR